MNFRNDEKWLGWARMALKNVVSGLDMVLHTGIILCFLGRLLSFSLQVQPMEKEPILLLMPAILLMIHIPDQMAMGESIFMLYEYLQESTHMDMQD